MSFGPLWVLFSKSGVAEMFSFDEPTAKTKAHYSRAGRSCVVYWPEQPVTATSRCRCDDLTRTWRFEDRAALCGHLRECPMSEVAP